MWISHLANQLLKPVGLKIGRIPEKNFCKSERSWNLRILQGKISIPATVIDIGAGKGTPALYNAFPEADLMLIDPLSEWEEEFIATLRTRKGNYELCAVGAEDSTVQINIEKNRLVMSSLLKRTSLTKTGGEIEKRYIPQKTLDGIIDKWNLSPPFGLKVDTEGYEMEVLKGATNTLEKCVFIITEISIAKRFHESYRFSELISCLSKHGFELLDILNINYKPVRYIDAIFVQSVNSFDISK